jgi:hypothetical protein
MLLSKLTPDAAKPLTHPEEVLPTGPPFSHQQWIVLPQPGPRGGLRMRCAPGALALAPLGGSPSMFSF